METTAGLEVQEIEWLEKTFVCKKARIPASHLNAFYNDSCRLIYQTLQGRSVETDYPPFVIHYGREEKRHILDVAAAVPLKSPLMNIEGLEVITIPSTRALFMNHYGNYDHIHVAYTILEKYMLEHHYKRTWILEQYFTDPDIVRDPGRWKTGVYYLLK